jgi:hypothetical protein
LFRKSANLLGFDLLSVNEEDSTTQFGKCFSFLDLNRGIFPFHGRLEGFQVRLEFFTYASSNTCGDTRNFSLEQIGISKVITFYDCPHLSSDVLGFQIPCGPRQTFGQRRFSDLLSYLSV